MCGIAGFFDAKLGQEESLALLKSMLNRIRHRGPDGEGVFQCARLPFQLGMRRLGILDIPHGAQPIWNERHDIAVIFNGEIYNYQELRETLAGRGHQFKTQTDTEVLVHLYEEAQDELVQQLRGMFAFCILDLQKSRLLLARDHFGQKPLYYYATATRFAFASEIKALFALPFVGSELNPEALPDYLTWLSLPAPATHFRNVHKLGHGEILTVPLAPFKVEPAKCYWRMGFSKSPDIENYRQAIEMLDAALLDSTKRHMQSDVPVGVLLSSGVDSCSLTNYSILSGHRNLSSFTVGFEDGGSELEGARKTAEMLGTRHHEITLRAHDLVDSMDEVAWHLDEPVGDPAAFAMLHICRLASRHVKVLFGGEGSDELFAGYGLRYAGISKTLKRSDWVRKYLGFLGCTGASFPKSRWNRMRQRAGSNRAAELVFLRSEGLPGNYLNPACWDTQQQKWFLSRCDHYGQTLVSLQHNAVQDAQMLDISWQLPESLLQKADKMSMAASVELRCPFLDTTVADIVARTPTSMLIDERKGLGKMLLRSCVARRIPHAAQAPKNGFAFALAYWMRGKLRPFIEQDLFHSNASYASYLDPVLVRQGWNRFLAGEKLSYVFYSLWLYERWYRRVPEFCGQDRMFEESPVVLTSTAATKKSTRPEKSSSGQLRIIVAPDYRAANPYQQLLGNVLEQKGVELTYLKDYKRVMPLSRMVWASKGSLLHLHWPEAYFSASGNLHTFFRRLRFPVDLLFTQFECRFILTAHNLWPHDTRLSSMVRDNMTLCYKKAAAVIAHSPSAARLLKREFELSAEKIFVIPHGDLSVAYDQPAGRDEARRKLGLSKAKICLMLGAIAPYKGIEEAILWWKKNRPKATLVIAGGCRKPEYLKLITGMREGQPGILIKEGYLDDHEVALWMDAADVVLCNYRKILTSGAASLARSRGIPIILPARSITVDLMEPHPLVLRFQSMETDFEKVLCKAFSLDSDYDLAREWREYTSWERVGEKTKQVYEMVRDNRI